MIHSSSAPSGMHKRQRVALYYTVTGVGVFVAKVHVNSHGRCYFGAHEVRYTNYVTLDYCCKIT